MQVAILLYDRMTALDAIGPYEVLSNVPGFSVQFVAAKAGPVRTDSGALELVAARGVEEVARADVLLVPGGPGDEAVMQDPRLLDWVRRIHADSQWTTSVCTGALILGAAGVLRGLRATTYWMERDRLREFGAEPVVARWVEDGKVWTAAGVSAGIDMALALVQRVGGDDLSQAVQLAIEYDPRPPFRGGSPESAPPHVVALVRSAAAALIAARRGGAAA
jgi:transcriptional regulator GlxA family with amidase domain